MNLKLKYYIIDLLSIHFFKTLENILLLDLNMYLYKFVI